MKIGVLFSFVLLLVLLVMIAIVSGRVAYQKATASLDDAIADFVAILGRSDFSLFRISTERMVNNVHVVVKGPRNNGLYNKKRQFVPYVYLDYGKSIIIQSAERKIPRDCQGTTWLNYVGDNAEGAPILEVGFP